MYNAFYEFIPDMYAEELQLSLILKPELIIQSCYLHTSYKKRESGPRSAEITTNNFVYAIGGEIQFNLEEGLYGLNFKGTCGLYSSLFMMEKQIQYP